MKSANSIIEIPLDAIEPHPANRRVGGFDQGKLEQLAQSIAAVGVQQPAVVRAKGDGYELVAGERRWRAARIAGLSTLPCVVRELDDAEALRIQIVENLQREDVHPLDEADGFERLRLEGGYEVELIAHEVGRSAAYVYQRLKLLELVPEARKLLVDGVINAAQGILVARLAPGLQEEILKHKFPGYRRDNPPTARELDEYIKRSILMGLSRAPWKLGDAQLVPTAGSCLACSKRSGSAPTLFEDLGKKDFCSDRACYQKKGEALVAQQRVALAEVEHLEVLDGCVNGKTQRGVLGLHSWKECKKKDSGAVRVLVVGGDSPGRLTWGRDTSRGAGGGPGPSKEEKESRRIENLRAKALSAANVEIHDEILDRVELALGKTKKLPLEVLRMVVLHSWERLWAEYKKHIVRARDWGKPEERETWCELGAAYIRKMAEQDLLRFLVEIEIARGLTVDNNAMTPIPLELEQLAEHFGIDTAAISAAAHAKLGVEQADTAVPDYEDDDGDGDGDEGEEAV